MVSRRSEWSEHIVQGIGQIKLRLVKKYNNSASRNHESTKLYDTMGLGLGCQQNYESVQMLYLIKMQLSGNTLIH